MACFCRKPSSPLPKLLGPDFSGGKDSATEKSNSYRASDNLTNVFVLGWISRAKSAIVACCVAWILINLVAQTAVAVVTLAYSMNDGRDYNGTYNQMETANASDLTCFSNFFNHNRCGGDTEDVTTQSLAHAYGNLARSATCEEYTHISEVLASKNNEGYYYKRRRNQQEFAYRFNEYNPDDSQKAYRRFTNRTITASSGECTEYLMDKEPVNQNGQRTYYYKHDDFKGIISVPESSTAGSGTTWIYRGTQIPQREQAYRCGDRCIKMWALKARGPKVRDPLLYECPVTVSPVYNASRKEHDIENDLARLAASSIALEGRQSVFKDWQQYQLYTFGSAFETHYQEKDEIGANMAEFAIGTISTMARTNPPIQYTSLVPHIGSRLKVHWYFLIPLLAGIAGVHLAVFGSTVYLTWTYLPVSTIVNV